MSRHGITGFADMKLLLSLVAVITCSLLWAERSALSDRLFMTYEKQSSEDLQICGALEVIDGAYLSGGHSDSCFQKIPVTFEFCRMLLQISPFCSAMSYFSGNCWLHDRRRSSFVIKKQTSNDSASLRFLKLDPDLEPCTKAEVPIDTDFALGRFRSCYLASDAQVGLKSFSRLPRLGIVISVTDRWAALNKVELDAVVSNIKCYCSIHNYTFVRS